MGEMKKAFELIIKAGEKSIGDDYFLDTDGYKVCLECGQRIEADIEILGQIRRVPILCECRKKKLEDQRKEQRRREKAMKIRDLRRWGLYDKAYEDYRMENDDRSNPQVSDAVNRFIEKWPTMLTENVGLLLYGPVGTGKTFFAGAIANALIDDGVPVLMASVPDLVSEMSQGYGAGRAEVLKKLSYYPLLVLDDLGTERNTEYMGEQLNEIINARYVSGLPMIITTNLTPQELKNPADLRYKRIYDRILERCYPICVNGASRRATAAGKKRENLKDFFGV